LGCHEDQMSQLTNLMILKMLQMPSLKLDCPTPRYA